MPGDVMLTGTDDAVPKHFDLIPEHREAATVAQETKDAAKSKPLLSDTPPESIRTKQKIPRKKRSMSDGDLSSIDL